MKLSGKYGKPENLDAPAAESGTLRHRMQASTGALLDDSDFMALLSNGIRNRKSRICTYVITEDNELRFAETGASFQKDMDSKHAMHNCAQTRHVYAGELHIRKHITWESIQTEY